MRKWSGLLTLGAAGVVLAVACSGGDDQAPAAQASQPLPEQETTLVETVAIAPQRTTVSSGQPSGSSDQPAAYVLLNQRLIEGQATNGVDLTSPDSIFAAVFASLPGEVTVYPSENYYYFILYVEGRQVWGNMRLAAGSRENGELSFGYFEFDEFPVGQRKGISGSKFFSEADGVLVRELDRFTYTVGFEGKTVRFDLHQLEQTPPASLRLAPSERFIERTFDESGHQFALIFNEQSDYFLWVLNEDEPLPEALDPAGEGLLVGRRSGFAFLVDAKNADRKLLVGVRQLNIRRNDYYDGPFDQLADNYAEEVNIRGWIERAFPSLVGRIDTYGYYVDRDPPLRVALSTYYTYATLTQMTQFLALADQHRDPYLYISRAGRLREDEATAAAAPRN